MSRLLTIAALVLFLGACAEEPRLAEPAVTSAGQAIATIPPTSTSTPSTTLVPADSQAPAAGVCALTQDGYAVIELNPDVPSPRCTIVHSLDRIRLHNATDAEQTYDVGFGAGTLSPDELLTLGEELGTVWAKGVHVVKTSLYAGSGPEVWLK